MSNTERLPNLAPPTVPLLGHGESTLLGVRPQASETSLNLLLFQTPDPTNQAMLLDLLSNNTQGPD